jgi:hypothetical protein
MLRPTTANPEYVSGGGTDGYIDRIVALCLDRVVVNDTGPVSSQGGDPTDLRAFDVCELISWAAAAAGVAQPIPDRADNLLRFCRSARSLISVPDGLALKGALLFGSNMAGLSLGVRGQAIVHSPRSGVTVTTGGRAWTTAARLPGARGYR